MLKVTKVIGSILSSNMYIMFEEGNNDCWLVDIGDFKALVKLLPQDYNVKGVFLTHGHFDHIAGINDLLRRYPKCSIYTSEYGKEMLYSAKKNLSFYFSNPLILKECDLHILYENSIVKIFSNVFVEVLETPGHCPSCLTYFTDEFIFTGDSYIPEVNVVTKLPKGNKEQAQKSIMKITKFLNGRKTLSGHDIEAWNSIKW